MDTDVVTTPELEVTEAGERLRSLIADAKDRGAPMISALTMQSRLFDIYDDTERSDEALGLVQHHLTLTLSRNWFSPTEVSGLADEIDWALTAGLAGVAPADPEPAPA